MKHSGRSKKCISYHVIVICAEDKDMICVWVGSILNMYQYLCSEILASFFSRPCQKWLVCWYHIYIISSQRMILVKIVLFGLDHETYNLRSIWFDLFIKRPIQGPGKSEWTGGSVQGGGERGVPPTASHQMATFVFLF